MKRTVRVFCAAFAAALSLSLISGCKPGDATESGTSGSETKKNVTLTLASWEVNALKAPWMAKFTEKHPEIKVELAEEGKWLGTEDLAKLAAANKMPDIINVENIYTPVKNNWLMDISSYYQNDPDKAAIYENFIEFGSIGGKLYVLPSNVFFHGIKVNLTLLEDLNIPKPGYDWTIDDFMNILKASSVKGESIGTNNIIWLMKHLPAQMNDELGWAAYTSGTPRTSRRWRKAPPLSRRTSRSSSSRSTRRWKSPAIQPISPWNGSFPTPGTGWSTAATPPAPRSTRQS